ncbi:MAG: hypothetical protein JRM72_09180 [Nitrososphaerota archaeon]|nr:hypothetical protein [Nitrososphaerota archaeon]
MMTLTFTYLMTLNFRWEEHSNLVEMAVNGINVDIDGNILEKISLLSSMDVDRERVYLLYKQKKEIGYALDVMKDEIENDK